VKLTKIMYFPRWV